MGFGGEDLPRLALAARIAALARLGIVGVDLHRQLFAGEEIFDEQRRIVLAHAPRRLEPDLADRGTTGGHIVETGPEIMATPGLLDALGLEANGGHGRLPSGAPAPLHPRL